MFREKGEDGVIRGICDMYEDVLAVLVLSLSDFPASETGVETEPSMRIDDELGLNDFRAFRSGPTFFCFPLGGVPILVLDGIFDRCGTAGLITSELDGGETTGRRIFFWFATGIRVEVATCVVPCLAIFRSRPLSEPDSGVELAPLASDSKPFWCIRCGAVRFLISTASSESYGVSGWA